MERLIEGLSTAARGRGRCYGVSGPAGIGKTFIIRRLEKSADTLGFRILKGRADPGATPSEVFSGLLPPSSKDLVDQPLPLLLRDRLAERSAVAPLLMTIDDLHLTDPSLISTLLFLSRDIVDLPAMIAFSFDSEMLDASYGDVHPLLDGIRILIREGGFEEIKLHNLNRTAMAQIVEEELIGPVDDDVAELIWERSEGNPMMAIEAARLLVQSRQVERRRGRWTATGPLRLELPDDCDGLIRRRLDLLAPEDRETLIVGAAMGRAFDPRVVADVKGEDLLDVLERLDRISHDHQVLESDSERYRFLSGAMRNVLLEDLPPDVLTDIHGRIARTLEHKMMRDAPFDDLSEHYFQAEKREKCACFSLLAGHRSLSDGDPRAAVEHFQKVLNATSMGGFEEERRFALEGMADAEASLGMAEAAAGKYQELLRMALSPAEQKRIERKIDGAAHTSNVRSP